MASACQPIKLASLATSPSVLAVNATDIYWTEFVQGLWSLPLAGGVPTVISAEYASGFALDTTHIYWGTNGYLQQTPLGGGAVTHLTPGGWGITPKEWGVAADATFVYWTDQAKGLFKVPIGGGEPITIATAGISNPGGIVIDATTLYWANAQSTIQKIPLAGGSVTTLAAGQESVQTLAIDAGYIYWTNTGLTYLAGSVNRVAKAGGAVTILATAQDDPAGLAVDATDVYWVNGGDKTVNRVAKGGGVASVLATGQVGGRAIAVDAKAVYWLTADASAGELWKMAK